MGVIARWGASLGFASVGARPLGGVSSARLVVGAVLVVAALGVMPQAAHAAAFRGTIVDAETGQPLQGVVIFAAWFRRYTGIVHGWVGNDYYASEETISGPDGKFVLKDHSTWTFLPFITKIDGPEFVIFKAGYGQWRFHGSRSWPSHQVDLHGLQERYDEAWKRFRTSGATLELPRLLTREERRLSWPTGLSAVPVSRMPKLLEAMNEEAVSLGLEPVRVNRGSAKDANR